MESEPDRDRASLLTSARPRAWASTAPLSARGWLTELARCPAGNRRSRRESRAGSSPAPSALDDEPARERAPVRSGMGPKGLGLASSVIRAWKAKLPGQPPA
jgi:hypothetical protein